MNTLRITAAIAVAILSCITSPRESWGRITGTASLLWNMARGKTKLAPPDTIRARLAACEKCPVFFSKLRTCGTPLTKDLRGMGCYCNLDLKARINEAGCWGEENFGEDFKFGWRESVKSGTV